MSDIKKQTHRSKPVIVAWDSRALATRARGGFNVEKIYKLVSIKYLWKWKTT